MIPFISVICLLQIQVKIINKFNLIDYNFLIKV